MQKKFALLDRDGTIIVDKAYLSTPDDIEFEIGAIEGLRLLVDSGFQLILITNQSGVARGYFDIDALEQIHARLKELLSHEGITLEAIYFCPHGPADGCGCRKPAPGMIASAMNDFGFTPEQAVFIGDSIADMEAAAASGVRAVRIIRENDSKFEMGALNFFEAAAKACAMLSSS